MLDELNRYRQRGRFPVNPDFRRAPIPQFMDVHGKRCAVAHLMEVSGQGEVVHHIAATENDARVSRLARHGEVRQWLHQAGLSLEEAARIQPSYCFLTEGEACFCDSSGLASIALATVLSRDDGGNATVRIDRLEGASDTLSVDDEIDLYLEEANAETVFLGQNSSDSPVERVLHGVQVDGDNALCVLNPRTSNRPLHLDTLFSAMLEENNGCVDTLRTDDSGWNESQCFEENEGSGDTGQSKLTGGCHLSPHLAAVEASQTAALTLLFALLARRRALPLPRHRR